MSINGQGHSLTLVKCHSDFKVKCLTFGLYTQVSDSGPLGPLVFLVAKATERSKGLTERREGVRVGVWGQSPGRAISDIGDAEFGTPGCVKPGMDANKSLPRIPADA